MVTDRGEVVAELIPPRQGIAAGGLPSGLVLSARKGQLTLGAPNDSAVYPEFTPLLRHHRPTELLDQERGVR